MHVLSDTKTSMLVQMNQIARALRAAKTAADGTHGTILGLLDAVLGLDVTTVTVSTDGSTETAPDVETLSFDLTSGVTNSTASMKVLVRVEIGKYRYHGTQ